MRSGCLRMLDTNAVGLWWRGKEEAWNREELMIPG